MKTLTAADGLAEAEKGSYYTVVGAGGPLGEWLAGYEGLLEQAEIGKPQEWFTAKGDEVNRYLRRKKGGEIRPRDEFQPDITLLFFPLDGLDVGRLAGFRLRMEDRWFDDIVQNVRRG